MQCQYFLCRRLERCALQQAARRKMLKPNGFVHRARACALCAIAIVVEAICFVKEASACAVDAAHSTYYCRVFLVQAGPFLAKLRVLNKCQSFQCVCALSITHSSFDPSMSLKSFLTRPHLRTVTFFMSGNEVPSCVSASVSVGAHTLYFVAHLF